LKHFVIDESFDPTGVWIPFLDARPDDFDINRFRDQARPVQIF
jgi:hypothetical protein